MGFSKKWSIITPLFFVLAHIMVPLYSLFSEQLAISN